MKKLLLVLAVVAVAAPAAFAANGGGQFPNCPAAIAVQFSGLFCGFVPGVVHAGAPPLVVIVPWPKAPRVSESDCWA